MIKKLNPGTSGVPRVIVQIGPDISAPGGIAAVLKSYASYGIGFEQLGYRMVFISSGGGSARGRLRKFIAGWCRLLWLLLYRDVFLVHIHFSIKGSLLRKTAFALICIVFRKKYFVHIHSGAFAEHVANLPRAVRAVARTILRRAARVICLSTQTWEQLILMKLTVPERCLLIYNGIDDPLVEPPEWRESSRPVVITYLAKLSESKGIFRLCKALAALPKSVPEYTLVVGGAGDASILAESVSRYGLQDRVAYKGWITGEDKVRLLSSSGIFVLPSRCEGHSIAIVEAMAFGIAVASTLIPGVVDAIRQGQDGLLVDPDDVDGLRDVLLQLLTEPDLRKRLGASARQRFLDQYTIQKAARALALAYDDVG